MATGSSTSTAASIVDFALGDTGAMAGHSPRPTTDAVMRRIAVDGGITTMLPTEDAEWVAADLSASIRPADLVVHVVGHRREPVGAFAWPGWSPDRPKILVFSYCYHGTVDESFIVLGPDGPDGPVSRPGNVGPAVDPSSTTRVVEWNDLAALERELAHGDVAAILTEPALTNIGIVLPEPGFLDGIRQLATDAGTRC